MLSLTLVDAPASAHWDCLSFATQGKQRELDDEAEYENFVPATSELRALLRRSLQERFMSEATVSLLLLHITQLEQAHILPRAAVFQKRERYHAPESFLEQVLVNMRRSIRADDQLLVHGSTGAALLLPDVDRVGAERILERVYHSINLLQPETVIPPLKRETEIVIGIGSYPHPSHSLEALLAQASIVARRIILRPAVRVQLPIPIEQIGVDPATFVDEVNKELKHQPQLKGIPFMHLPSRVPSRLKHLLPYELARELRCAPVGRDHNRLTVAMADPTDTGAIERLREATKLTIFPVSCEIGTLEILLEHGW